MAKKSRRNKARYRSRTTNAVREGASQQPGLMPSAPRAATRLAPGAQDLSDRYQHVKPELKRIGIIAGAMILVLIVLSLIFPHIPHW